MAASNPASASEAGTGPPLARRWPELVGDEDALVAERVAPAVLRLCERIVAPAERSFFYLVEGAERDCLIDGGWGFCRSLARLRRDARRPLVAVATHSHFDHVGLLHLADMVLAHPAEASTLRDPNPYATQALPYLEGRPALAGGGSIAPDSIVQQPCRVERALADGDSLDLGGTELRVLHVPGHSPGSLALLDARAGLLFAADTVHDGHIWDDILGADRAALLASHERLAALEFDTLLAGHGAVLTRGAALGRMARYRRDVEKGTGG